MSNVNPTTATTIELENIILSNISSSIRVEQFLKEYATRTDRNEDLRTEMRAGTLEKLRQYEMLFR